MLEVAPEDEELVRAAYAARGLSAVAVGSVGSDRAVSISVDGEPSISGAPRSRMVVVLWCQSILLLWTPVESDEDVHLSTAGRYQMFIAPLKFTQLACLRRDRPKCRAIFGKHSAVSSASW